MVRNAATSIVFLDAYRDNPLAANLAQTSRSLNVGRGPRPRHVSEPGKVALDGSGRNSPFTAALLRHIDSEGEGISDVDNRRAQRRFEGTSGKQRPFESASLTGQFFFKPAPAKTAEKSSTTDTEIASLRSPSKSNWRFSKRSLRMRPSRRSNLVSS
jgi:uncharacterized caspase-like protein